MQQPAGWNILRSARNGEGIGLGERDQNPAVKDRETGHLVVVQGSMTDLSRDGGFGWEISERMGGEEDKDGAGGSQGGKPKKKEMKQGRSMRWVETRNAMTIRTDGEVATLLRANLDVAGTTPIHLTAMPGKVPGTSRHCGQPSSPPEKFLYHNFCTSMGYLYPLVTLILQATAQRESKSFPLIEHRRDSVDGGTRDHWEGKTTGVSGWAGPSHSVLREARELSPGAPKSRSDRQSAPNIKCFHASQRAASAVVTVVDAQILSHPMNHPFPTSRSSF